jgi:hypothetical protein
MHECEVAHCGRADTLAYPPCVLNNRRPPLNADPWSGDGGDYYAFLVRVSRAGADHPWEIVVKDVATGDEYPFPDSEALLRFVRDRLPDAGSGRANADPGGPPSKPR